MTSLVLMYVFYDKNGDIKAIMPHFNDNFSDLYNVATFPLSDVEMFLSAEKSTFDYTVKKTVKASDIKYTIVKKEKAIKYTRTINSYLTKIEGVVKDESMLTFTHDINSRKICIEIDNKFKERYLTGSGTEKEQEITERFFNSGSSAVYLTKRNNPYCLLFSFSFTPDTFVSVDKLYFEYKDIGMNTETSMYTKKIINEYGYKEGSI